MKKKYYVMGGALLAAVGIIAIMKDGSTIPKTAVAVKPFNVDKYLGKWYEIARMDYRFERNLNNTMAEYSMNKDGSIKVVNSGFNYKKEKYEEVTGKAVFAGSPDEAMLKVSFFGPFYSGYNVVAIDPEYKYALVVGKNLRYMWILSRTPNISKSIKKEYLQKATDIGYDISQLVWPEQSILP